MPLKTALMALLLERAKGFLNPKETTWSGGKGPFSGLRRPGLLFCAPHLWLWARPSRSLDLGVPHQEVGDDSQSKETEYVLKSLLQLGIESNMLA